MKLIADENIDRPIVAWLREQGHDVLEISVSAPSANDTKVVELAVEQRRILLTFDRDMGWIARTGRTLPPGVVYLRLRATGPALWKAFERIWPRVEPIAIGHFVTVRNDRVIAQELLNR